MLKFHWWYVLYVNICNCTHQTSSTDLKVVVHEGKEERGVGRGSQGGLLQIQQVGTIEHVPQCSHIAILQRWGGGGGGGMESSRE